MLQRRGDRPVITGFGVVAPNGIGKEGFWSTLKLGKSAISRISLFDTEGLDSKIAGEVQNFDPAALLDGISVKYKRCARHTQMAMVALREALVDAKLESGNQIPINIVMGAGIGAFDVVYDSAVNVTMKGVRRASPHLVTSAAPQATAATLAQMLACPGQVTTLSTACASGLDALGQAASMIKQGKAEIVITGGADSPISPVPFANLIAAGMASRRNDDPKSASRPFDKERDSGVISEGAVIVILESRTHALSRGVRPYLELLGFGNQIDAAGTEPGAGLCASMELAMTNAGCLPDDIDHVSAWGPSHPVMDRVETEAIKRVLDQHAYDIPVSSIKGVVGNPFSAAGPMQVLATALAMSHGEVPPTANYKVP